MNKAREMVRFNKAYQKRFNFSAGYKLAEFVSGYVRETYMLGKRTERKLIKRALNQHIEKLYNPNAKHHSVHLSTLMVIIEKSLKRGGK